MLGRHNSSIASLFRARQQFRNGTRRPEPSDERPADEGEWSVRADAGGQFGQDEQNEQDSGKKILNILLILSEKFLRQTPEAGAGVELLTQRHKVAKLEMAAPVVPR